MKIACLALSCTMIAGACRSAVTITVTAPDHDCVDLPISAKLPAGLALKNAVLVKADGSKVTAQVVDGTLYWILDRLQAGKTIAYTVQSAKRAEGGVEMTKIDEGVEVKVGGELLTRYLRISGHKPICYPIIGPGGKAMTRNFPMKKFKGESPDHVHHRSFWFTHGDVNGVDFWGEVGHSGKIIQKSIEFSGGPVMGIIRTKNDWVDAKGKRICADEREMRVYSVKNGKMYDFRVKVSAPDGPVTFGDTKEGTFGFRTAATIKPDARKGGVVINSNGQKNKDAWGKRACWVDMNGPVDGDTVGIAMLEHPTSFRAPTYWHARTYGLVAANPFGLKQFTGKKGKGSHTIKKGESITFVFRIWLHEGDAEKARVADAWKQYADPPKVAVK